MENLGCYAYRTLADGAMASSSTVIPTAGEGVDFEENDAGQLKAMEAYKEEGLGAEGTERENVGATKEEAEKIEGLEHTGDV